jgi:hypothetical protein
VLGTFSSSISPFQKIWKKVTAALAHFLSSANLIQREAQLGLIVSR